MKFTVAFLISALLPALLYCQDYCANNLCKSGKKHIGCGTASRSFSTKCPKNAKRLDLKPYKSFIVDQHNIKRNYIASGKLKGYEAATRMATMEWDDELAYLASLNVHQCEMKHDQCRNTRKFPQSGQNIGLYSYTKTAKTQRSLKYVLQHRINGFFNEYKDANMNTIRSYPGHTSGPKIGHFTVFVVDKNNRVGCAASEYIKGKMKSILFTCNYGSTNVLGKPIYVGGRSASGCKSGNNSALPGLCSMNEVY